MPGKTLNYQAQQMILNPVECFEQEKRNGGPLIPVSAVQERVADALKLSQKTIYSMYYRKERKLPSFFFTWKHCQKSMTRDLPERTKMAVRDTLYNMYEKRRHVTVGILNEELKRREIIHVGKTLLITTLKKVDFKFKKEDNRRTLTERVNIAAKRGKFLRNYCDNMNSHFL